MSTQSDDKEKAIKLARKIYRLAYHPTTDPGTADVAKNQLQRLLVATGLTMEDIKDEPENWYPFSVPAEHREMANQIAASVTGKSKYDYITYNPYTYRQLRGTIYMQMTEAQAMECKDKIAFYIARWEEDLKTFRSAFIQKNMLYKKETDEDREERLNAPPVQLSPEERAEMWRRINMQEGLQTHTYNKTLGDGK